MTYVYPTKNKYVGKRYVPKFMGLWDTTKNTPYEALSVVQYEGSSYTSKTDVPTGVSITNEAFWSCTGNYNQQIEDYRQAALNTAAEVEAARGGQASLDVRLDEVDTTLANKSTLDNKHVDLINDKLDNIGSLNVANFAGQDLGVSAPIANAIHNYTDGIALQIDEVGEGNSILVLKNANNPSRRPDKAAGYIGNATFLDCIKHNSGGGASTRIFKINSDGNFYWFDKTTTALLYGYKDDDNTPAFQLESGKKHVKILQLQNGGMTDVQINHNGTTNYLDILAGAGVLGMTIQNITGDIQIKPATSKLYVNGVIYGYENGAYSRCVTASSGATGSRPTPTYIGQPYYDVTLGKPIWCHQYTPSVIWHDATGAAV